MTPKWKFWLRSHKSVVVCVPFTAKEPNDIVQMLARRLPAACQELAECYVVNKEVREFAALRPDREERKLRSLVIFAHPDDLLRDLASDFGSITANWWSRPPYEFGVVVAHVCQGYRIMKLPDWTKVFPNWVTFTVNIDALLVKDDDDAMWAGVAKAITAAAAKSQKPLSLKSRMRSIYYETIADIFDGGGKAYVHSMHLQAAIDGLISSDDMSS